MINSEEAIDYLNNKEMCVKSRKEVAKEGKVYLVSEIVNCSLVMYLYVFLRPWEQGK